MRDVTHEASQEGRHDIEIGEVIHKVTFLGEVVEISGQIYYLDQVVVRVLLIGGSLNSIEQAHQVFVSY